MINNMVNDYDKQIEGLESKLESLNKELSDICEKLGISGIPDDRAIQDEINKVERDKEKSGQLENVREKLEDALNKNLGSLAESHNFEQTVMSLAAAINLFSTKVGQTAASSGSAFDKDIEPGQAA